MLQLVLRYYQTTSLGICKVFELGCQRHIIENNIDMVKKCNRRKF